MRKDIEDKYLSLFRSGEKLTQKEVAARLNCSVASASNNLRTLYEKGILRVEQKPGMSMRYFREGNPLLLRSPNGNPLYLIYFPGEKLRSVPECLDEFIKSLVTSFLNGDISQETIASQTLPTLRLLTSLSEVLSTASPEQIKTTLDAYERNRNADKTRTQ